jgi:hypothetical protein
VRGYGASHELRGEELYADLPAALRRLLDTPPLTEKKLLELRVTWPGLPDAQARVAGLLRVFVITWDPLEHQASRPEGFATINVDRDGSELVVYLPIWSLVDSARTQRTTICAVAGAMAGSAVATAAGTADTPADAVTATRHPRDRVRTGDVDELLAHHARGRALGTPAIDLVSPGWAPIGLWNYHATRISAGQSPAPGETTASTNPDAPDEEQPPPVPQMSIPSDLEQAETVGIMFDAVEGLWFLPEYRLVREVFADPTLIAGRRHRDAVSGYLKSQSIPPIVLRRLAEQDPDPAGRVLARLLGKPRFTWQRDGETLLRRYKPRFFERTLLPGVTPLSNRQRAFLRS